MEEEDFNDFEDYVLVVHLDLVNFEALFGLAEVVFDFVHWSMVCLDNLLKSEKPEFSMPDFGLGWVYYSTPVMASSKV